MLAIEKLLLQYETERELPDKALWKLAKMYCSDGLGGFEKLAVVATALKISRRLALMNELAKGTKRLKGGIKPVDIRKMTDERKLFEARQLTIDAFDQREIAPFKSKLHGETRKRLQLDKLKRLEGGKESTRNIYTDGSHHQGTTSGGAAYSINGDPPTRFSIKATTSNDAERQAAIAAIHAAPDNFRGNLYTDSVNVLSNKDIRWQAWQKKIGLRKVKGHSGVEQNEAVDRAAKSAFNR